MSAVDGTVGPWSLLAPIRTRMRAVVALSVLSSVATVASLVGIIDIAMTYPEAPEHRTWLAVAVIVVAATVRMAADGAAGMLSHRADNDLQLHLRRRLVAQIRKLPLGWLDARRSSGIIESVEKDVAAVHQLMGHTVGETVVAVLVPLLSLIALVAVDWRIAAVAVVPVLVTFALMGVMISRGAGLQRDYERASEGVTAAVIELVRGIPVMKSFGRANQGAGRYDAAALSFVRAWSAWSRQSNIYLGLIDVVTSPTTVLAVVCGAGLALRDAAGGIPEGLVAGLVLSLGLSAAIVRVAMNSEPIIAGIAALKSIAEVLGTPPIAEPADPVPVHGGALEVRNLVFSYGDGPRVLDGMSATFEPGTLTALVGSSGSGKSTVARLLARFHDPVEGSVLLGGADLRDIAVRDVHRSVSVVFQDPQLFTLPLRENIRLARRDATDDEIMAAAKLANLDAVIAALPKRLDSVVNVDVTFSGGEAQRVAIARSIVTDAPVLIFDEATAYADPASEALIQSAIERLARSRTVIVIAHRLSTIRNADRILVLDGGAVAEAGTHDELLARGGRYRDLWRAFTLDDEPSAPRGAESDDEKAGNR